jgi:hypothetical protein
MTFIVVPNIIVFSIFSLFVLKILQFTEVIYFNEVEELIQTLENMRDVDEEELRIL